MKRTLLMICLVLCLLPASAFAATRTYYLDEPGMSIDLPDDLVVFTRDTEGDDPYLFLYGWTRDDLLSILSEFDIYLDAWEIDANYEIIVTMMDSIFDDFNQFSDTSFSALTSSLSEKYESSGITYMKSDFYQHSQAKFIKIYISQPYNDNGDIAYGLQYYTVYNGKAINITLQSYSGRMDSNKEAIIQAIVDSVHFDTEPQPYVPPTQTEAFTYTAKDSGMTFTVPENWVEAPVGETQDVIDAKFTSTLEDGLYIFFSSDDTFALEGVKENVSESELLSLPRSAVGNDLFTKADIAKIYGCEESDVSMVTYGGKEYYSAEVDLSGTPYDSLLSRSMVYLLRCENGYLYIFQFNGSRSSEYFQDFESLVSSAEYPAIGEDSSLPLRIAIGAAIIIVLIILAVICVLLIRKKKKRANNTAAPADQDGGMLSEPAGQASIPPERTEPEAPPSVSVSFCHNCGCRILQGSRFCHKCGTPLFAKEEE